jgi:hypothetical protein
MVLSYSLRVTCLIGVTLAILQVTMEIFLWIGTPAILRVVQSLALRQRERMLYLVQLLPVIVAILLTGLFFLPQYVSNETNLAPEHVGRLCIVLAASLYVWWGARIVRGIRMVGRTILFSRACRLVGQDSESLAPGTRLVTVSDQTPRVALVGLLRPFILVSKSLLDDGGLDPLALQVVLDHERSHATQRDNWKLLSLYCLPRLDMRLPGGKTWMQLWQSTAEWAADDDAVGDSSARALMLAETLVALARTQSAVGQQIACTYLVCEDTELAQRVERLVNRTPEVSLTQLHKTGLLLGFVALCVVAGSAAFSSVVRYLPEHLLHLG